MKEEELDYFIVGITLHIEGKVSTDNTVILDQPTIEVPLHSKLVLKSEETIKFEVMKDNVEDPSWSNFFMVTENRDLDTLASMLYYDSFCWFATWLDDIKLF